MAKPVKKKPAAPKAPKAALKKAPKKAPARPAPISAAAHSHAATSISVAENAAEIETLAAAQLPPESSSDALSPAAGNAAPVPASRAPVREKIKKLPAAAKAAPKKIVERTLEATLKTVEKAAETEAQKAARKALKATAKARKALKAMTKAKKAARRAEVSAADSEDACRRRLRDLLTQVRVFAPAAADLSGIQLALSDARRRKTALADARQTAREAALYRDALRVQLPEQPAAESSIQRPALSREEAAAELARTQALLAQERTRFDTLTGRIRALDRSSDLEAQLAQKQEQLTSLQDEYDAIALAMDALSQANTVLQNRFSPALGARAAEIFSAITGGRYDRVLLSRDFSLSAEPAGDPVGRSVRLLSQGAADQLYLAVRLAICDMVLPADKRVPLILDDALVTFDDERLHAALDYLLEESQRRQILLFTCQKREMDYLQGKENVTVTKL